MSADSFAQGYSTFVAYLAEPALRALVVGCVAATALAALRVKRVSARLMVWTGVLYVALAMPLAGFLPRVRVGVPAVPMLQNLQARFHRAQSAVQLASVASAPLDCTAPDSACPSDNASLRPTESGVRTSMEPVGSLRTENLASKEHASAGTSGKLQDGILRLRKPSFAHADKSANARDDRLAFREQAPNEAKASLVAAPIAVVRPVASGSAQISRDSSASVPRRGFAFPWTAFAVAIYLLGVVILLARLLVGVLLSRRLDRAAQNIDDREALRLLRFRACFAGLVSTPRLKESAMLSVPATVGVHRPAILLPSDWRLWAEQELDAILAHEVSHVARRDALTQHLSLVHRAIFWFSPLAWWLDRQLTELAEEASDEAALAGGADRTRYAETLLGFFAQLKSVPGRVWWQGVSMAKKSGNKAGRAERRVDRILAWKGAISMKKSFAVMLIAFAAPLVFFAASVHPFVASAQDAPKTQPTSDKKSDKKSDNVILPGGPVAPALPNAPKGGVKGGVSAPALPPAPQGGVVAPAMAPAPRDGVVGAVPATPSNMAPPAPGSAPALAGPVAYSVRPTPALMPVPGAPARAPLVPGPIADGPVTPSALTAPATAPYASFTPLAPVAPFASAAPRAQSTIIVGSGDVQSATAQLRAAKAQLDAIQASNENSPQLSVALKKLKDATAALSAAADEASKESAAAQLRAAKAQLEALHAANSAQLLAARENLKHAAITLRQAQEAMGEAQDQSSSSNTIINGSINMGSGPRYVMMYGNSNEVSMSGTDEDLEHARKLRDKLKADFIWFERDEKSYVITDPGFIAKVKALFAPEDELGKQEDALGRQEDDLGRQEDALGNQMENVKVKIPDITPDLERVRARLKELQSGATQTELGQLQSELGQLQSEVGRHQSEAGVQQSAIGRQQGDLGRKQAELGRQQAELGRKQAEISRQATRQLRQMFDDAIASGLAKPE